MTDISYLGHISRASYDNWTDYVPMYHSYYKSYKRLQQEKKRTKRQRKIFLFAVILTAVLFLMGARNSFGESSEQLIHYVSEGDTLWSVAREYKPKGMTTGEYVYKIRKANAMESSAIKIGDEIIIPE